MIPTLLTLLGIFTGGLLIGAVVARVILLKEEFNLLHLVGILWGGFSTIGNSVTLLHKLGLL